MIDSADLFSAWWVMIAIALPFVYPFIVRAGAAGWFKWVFSLVVSVAVAATTLASMPWGDITGELVVNRAAVFVGIVATTYKAADYAIRHWVDNHGRGLNEAGVYRPERGLSESTFTPSG